MSINEETVPEAWAGLSNTWQRIFAAIQTGEPFINGMPANYAKLPMSARFSFLGFFFGPLYYWYLKMYQKGCLMMALGFLLLVPMELISKLIKIDSSQVYAIPLAVICAQWVKIDYYKYRVHDQVIWQKFAGFASIPRAVAAMVASFVAVFVIQMLFFNS